jgi:hypothetical protein
VIVLRLLVFLLGLALIAATLLSAVKTFVLPRSAPDQIVRWVFVLIRRVFDFRLRWAHSYSERDRVMAFFAPISLLALVPVWLALILAGYAGMYWSLGEKTWSEAILLSGSSLLTLGFAATEDLLRTLLSFSEATIGLILIALLIAYLPTMYAAFSRREAAVDLLEVRAGSPPSAVEMILRYHRIHGLERLSEQWQNWEGWFVDIEESHTSLAALVFFRSPEPEHSWITAAGAVLDAASLTRSTLDIPTDPQADLCIRAGFLALRRIAEFFEVPYNPDPHYGDPIHVIRGEFDAAYEMFVAQDVPVKSDKDQAWRDFSGWRVNYDSVLVDLANLTMAPPAPWSGDRSDRRTGYPAFLFRHKGRASQRKSNTVPEEGHAPTQRR